MPDNDEEWQTPQHIVVILAHPDDPEFFCGATLAMWAKQGHVVDYYLLTRGDKGSQDRAMTPQELTRIREKEERSAAQVLGIRTVNFLNYEDGTLIPDLETRKAVVQIIRQEKPDVVVTCDPTNLFVRDGAVNHPDHRAAGQIVIDGLFPAAGNPMFFPELLKEGLEPHSVKELWLSLPSQPNLVLDITAFWPTKLRALHEHRSQIGDIEKFDKRMYERRIANSTAEAPRFEEKFRRIIFR
jgi:LmbE family N-acetylglucosaminyl deacetylase